MTAFLALLDVLSTSAEKCASRNALVSKLNCQLFTPELLLVVIVMATHYVVL